VIYFNKDVHLCVSLREASSLAGCNSICFTKHQLQVYSRSLEKALLLEKMQVRNAPGDANTIVLLLADTCFECNLPTAL